MAYMWHLKKKKGVKGNPKVLAWASGKEVWSIEMRKIWRKADLGEGENQEFGLKHLNILINSQVITLKKFLSVLGQKLSPCLKRHHFTWYTIFPFQYPWELISFFPLPSLCFSYAGLFAVSQTCRRIICPSAFAFLLHLTAVLLS